jgi:hypothetical protein
MILCHIIKYSDRSFWEVFMKFRNGDIAMRNSDICLSIRSIKQDNGKPGSFEAAMKMIEQLKPTRIEWSYITDREQITQIKKHVPVFVAALNTINPKGHAVSLEGDPIVAPWMKTYGKPEDRKHYMCQNNPKDVQARIDQSLSMINDGITESFQHDDWYCNAQMLNFGNPCFCEYCMNEFREYLGFEFDFNYHTYLRRRGIMQTDQLLDMAKAGKVPLWNDFSNFTRQAVSLYFRKLKTAMDRFAGKSTSLSVNGSVLNFGGQINSIMPYITYLHGETRNFTPAGLKQLADASCKLGIKQVVSFFPEVSPDQLGSPDSIAKINHAIALCYCLGLLPLFPYDVWTGPEKPRWYGTWEDYSKNYEIVREHPEWFDDYIYDEVKIGAEQSIVICRYSADPTKTLRHTIEADGKWQTQDN